MKRIIYVFFILTVLLFATTPVLAQDNFTINVPSGVFELTESGRYGLTFAWKISKDIGGESYQGSTAYEMSQSIAAQHPFLRLDHWSITRGDDNYIYGYCQILYFSMVPCIMTFKGLRGPSETVVLNMGGD